MSKQYDWRTSQNKRFRSRNKKRFSFKDVSYIILSGLIVASYFNSLTHIKYINTPVKQTVEKPSSLLQFAINPIPHVYAQVVTPSVTPTHDMRVNKLKAFFIEKGSPLANYAQRFVDDADTYGLDYTLMPAISCKESSCGLALPAGSNNPFGLGGSNFMWFSSWEQSIDYEADLLSNNYRSNMVYAIGSKYCPSSDNCAPNWADVVTSTQYEIINK